MNPIKIRIVFKLLLLLLSAGSVFANEQKTIQVVTEYLAHYQLLDDSGDVYGYSPSVVDRLFEITGFQQERQVLPWARAYKTALNGKNVLIYSMARTSMREDKFHWIGSLSHEKLHFWGLASKFPEPLTSWRELEMFQVAVSIGSNPEQYLTGRKFPRIYRVNDSDVGLAMMLKDRTDLIVASRMGLADRVPNFKKVISDFTPVFEIEALNSNLSVAFSLDSDPEILMQFRAAFGQLESSGELQRLRDKWNIPNSP